MKAQQEKQQVKDIKGNVLGYIVASSKTKGYFPDNIHGMENGKSIKLIEVGDKYAILYGRMIHTHTSYDKAKTDFDNAQKGKEVIL